MAGNIEDRGTDKQGRQVWRLRVSTGHRGPDGRYEVVTSTVRGSRRDAERALADLVSDVGRGKVVAGALTVAELAARWLAELERADEHSPRTLHEYRRIIDRDLVPLIGQRPVAKVRPADVAKVYRELRSPERTVDDKARPLSVTSIRHHRAILSGMWKLAVLEGWAASNVTRDVSPGRKTAPAIKRERTPTVAQVLALIDAARKSKRPELATYLRLVAGSGMRRGEACGVRWSDFDGSLLRVDESVYQLPGRRLDVKDTKTHAERTVALDPATVAEVLAHRATMEERARECGVEVDPDGFVFSDAPRMTVPWKPDSVTQAFGRLRDRLGMPAVVLHGLRHFHVTELRAAGLSASQVGERVGHASQQTTGLYDHGRDDRDTIAAGVIGELLS